MDICMSKTEWKEVLVGLHQVPNHMRGDAWVKAGQLIYGIVESPNSLADQLNVDVKGMCFDEVCHLCNCYIKLGQDYAFRGVPGMYNHLDCWYQDTPEPDEDEEAETE